jgi:hypothetical protein
MLIQTLCQVPTDRPQGLIRSSILARQIVLAPLLLELCFCFRLCWDLFLGLVGPL